MPDVSTKPPAEEILWPADHLPCLPMWQCAVLDCERARCCQIRGGREVMRRYCPEHAHAYDADRFRAQLDAKVIDVMTGQVRT